MIDVFQAVYTLSSTTHSFTCFHSRNFVECGVGNSFSGISIRCCSIRPVISNTSMVGYKIVTSSNFTHSLFRKPTSADIDAIHVKIGIRLQAGKRQHEFETFCLPTQQFCLLFKSTDVGLSYQAPMIPFL